MEARRFVAILCGVSFSPVLPQRAVRTDRGSWGLDDFDDPTRGPAFVEVVRFLGSLDLASRQRGWSRARDRLWNRFFEPCEIGGAGEGRLSSQPGDAGRLLAPVPARLKEWTTLPQICNRRLENRSLCAIISTWPSSTAGSKTLHCGSA